MKLARLALWCLGALLVLIVAAMALAFVPAVQTWVARRALAHRPGLGLSVGAVSVGLERQEFRAVRLERSGAVLVMPSLSLEMRVIPDAVRGRLAIRRLEARGWTLDLTRTEVRADPVAEIPAAASQVFQGFFRKSSLPSDFELEGVELEGVAVLRSVDGRAAVRVEISISGGGIEAGKEGRLDFSVRRAPRSGGPQVVSAVVDGNARIRMDTPRTFDRLALDAHASTAGAGFNPAGNFSIRFDGERNGRGERYSASLETAGVELAMLRAEFTYGSGVLSGSWKLNLDDAALAPLSLGRPLPPFTAASEGSFESGGTLASVHADGRLTATADWTGLPYAGLPAIGGIRLTASFDVALRGGALRVDELTANLDGPHPFLSVRALQPFEFDARTGVLKVADPGSELLDIAFEGVPLEWARPYLGDYSLAGGELHGEILAGARAGGLAIRPKLPLTIEGLSVSRTGRPILTDIDVLLSASADYAPSGWRVTASPLIARDRGGDFIVLDAAAGRLAAAGQPVEISGRLDSNLPAVLSQPAIAGATALRNGSMVANFSAALGTTSTLGAKIGLTNLWALDPRPSAAGSAGPEIKLPDVSLDIQAGWDPTGTVKFSAPVEFKGERGDSDLVLSGNAARKDGSTTLEAKITGNSIDIDTLKLISYAAIKCQSSISTYRNSRETALTILDPWFSGASGNFEVDLKKVSGGRIELSDLSGTIRMGPSGFDVDSVEASLGPGCTAKGRAKLSFDADLPEPYALKAEVEIANLDSAVLFRSFDPQRPPTVEGKFDVNAEFSGRSAEPADLGDGLTGEIQLKSKAGTFRGLALARPPAPAAEKPGAINAIIGDVAGAVGDVAGAVVGRKDLAEAAAKVSELADVLSAVPYDQIDVSASRDNLGAVVFKNFSLISPEIRLQGSGRTDSRSGAAVLDQPLSMVFTLGARDRAASLLKDSGLLEAKKDELGYAGCTIPLKIAGTLASPDTSQVRDALFQAAAARGAALLERLLGR